MSSLRWDSSHTELLWWCVPSPMTAPVDGEGGVGRISGTLISNLRITN
jgi:hypothetical protein